MSRSASSSGTVPVPAGREYMPFQVAGIQFAMSRPSTLIADEMGLGKTIQAIGVINSSPDARKILIVCPASLKLNWSMELDRWLVGDYKIGIVEGSRWPSDCDIVVVNYDILTRHERLLYRRTWDILILDEAHRLKNPNAQRTRAVVGSQIMQQGGIRAKRKLALTGTPILNRPQELASLLCYLSPEEFGRLSSFRQRFRSLRQLQRHLRSTIMIRRLKQDVLPDLPPRTRQVIVIPPGRAAEAVRDERRSWLRLRERDRDLRLAVESAKASGDQSDYDHALDRMHRQHGVMFHQISRIRKRTSIAKVPLVAEHIRDVQSQNPDKKLIVFAHHHEVIDALCREFPAAVKLDGRDSMDARNRSVRQFQHDPATKLFVGSIHAAGEGLTLTASSHVIFAELDWVPARLQQAEDRCHRIGQDAPVLIQHIVLSGTLDGNMAEKIVQKQGMITAALGDNTISIDEIL